MEPRRRKLLARVLLGAAVLGSGAWLATLDFERHISTDVLDLLPADQRKPELMLVRQMISQQQARAALFVLNGVDGGGTEESGRAAVAEVFIAALRSSPAFAEVVAIDDPAGRERVGMFFFERRFELLLPDWLEERAREHAAEAGAAPWPEWLAERVAGDLEVFLQQPDALGLEQALPADPLLLLPGLMESVDGLVDAGGSSSANERALIWARLAASPLSEAGQQPVFDAVDSALAAAQAVVPGVSLQWTAVSRFASESRRRIELEMSMLNTFSFLAVLSVAALCLRRVRQMLHLAPGVVCSFLGAWTVTTLVFDRVHILVFVIGSLLAGIAADYGLHIYLHPGRPGEDFEARLRAVRRPLLGSAVTAMIGFSALLFADLPLLRQVGVFVLAGLVSAVAGAVLWFAQVAEPRGELRPGATRGFSSASRGLRRVRWAAIAVIALVVAAGLGRVHWQDDVRDLDVHVPELWENDRAVREVFGESSGGNLFLARGDSPAAARAALSEFRAWLREADPETRPASIGFALPAPAAWEALPAHLDSLAGFEPALRAALERHGFDAGEFSPFFRAWWQARQRDAWPAFDELVRDFRAVLVGPAGMLYSTEPGASWFAVAVEGDALSGRPLAESVTNVGQLESLNDVFAGYRQSALSLSLIGLAAGAVSVLLIYGLRHGPRMILVPLGAALGTFGLLGLAGQTLNLFHLLGAFLALCLSLDYAIFTGDRAARGESGPPPSVRLSALNTTAAFGVLAFSRIPAVAGLGVTVALIALLALLMVELDLFQRRPHEKA